MAVTWNDLKEATDKMTKDQLSKPAHFWHDGNISPFSRIVELPVDYFRDFAPVWASPDGKGDKLYNKGDFIITQ